MRVPGTGRARALLWGVIGCAALAPVVAPAPPADVHLVRDGGRCRFSADADREPCACKEMPAEVRLALGVALPLEHASSAELEALPGIGPARAGAIVALREARGGLGQIDALREVPGIGAATIERLRSLLFVGSRDPACEASAAFPAAG